MRFGIRWTANAVAVFLALYLVDTLAKGRFQVTAAWVAVILALLLGMLNSLVRPLHRVRTKTSAALLRTVLTVLVNALILQLFIWAGASIHATSIVWTLVAAAFISLVTGAINWLVGFRSKEKAQPSAPRRTGARVPHRQTTGARGSRN